MRISLNDTMVSLQHLIDAYNANCGFPTFYQEQCIENKTLIVSSLLHLNQANDQLNHTFVLLNNCKAELAAAKENTHSCGILIAEDLNPKQLFLSD